MVAELGAVQVAIESLTNLDALPFMIVECIVTTIYTTWGGFHTSFITDNIQGLMVFLLLIVCSIAMGTQINIDTSTIGPSGLLQPNLLANQLIYILPVAIATNDAFLSGFWLRTFASRSDKDLLIGCTIATVIVVIFLTLVGVTGLLAVWAGLLGDNSDDIYNNSENAFFLVLLQLPTWVVGFVLVFTVALSTAAFDSLQSGLASSISNDVFRNKIPILYVRIIVILIIVPSIVVALRAPNILQVYLISDLISAAVIPVLLLGLSSKMYFVTGWEVVCSGLGGILTVFIFGTIYYGNASQGAGLIILKEGLYVNDWSAFGTFVAAPVGAFITAGIVLFLRLAVLFIHAKATNTRFTALDKPDKEDLAVAAGAADVSSLPPHEQTSLLEDMKTAKKALTSVFTRASSGTSQ
ncbi:hypothetical protein AWJ20_2909 [Sugiyamaella lignohabitans]|uniref:Urea transport protein n=1 Tax=Sugiyamaella lignohabitans TaxID=796027 RepID=A0A167FGW0_9ASCO|nr:uncharacterized protein AWJ20_2909 [Sugiyamaella lignohabitans]ANB15283.1 hypothetical protein AWJ20_2909 [Sugiyamaella lignohabitans]